MKLSEAIKVLKTIKEREGDIPIILGGGFYFLGTKYVVYQDIEEISTFDDPHVACAWAQFKLQKAPEKYQDQ